MSITFCSDWESLCPPLVKLCDFYAFGDVKIKQDRDEIQWQGRCTQGIIKNDSFVLHLSPAVGWVHGWTRPSTSILTGHEIDHSTIFNLMDEIQGIERKRKNPCLSQTQGHQFVGFPADKIVVIRTQYHYDPMNQHIDSIVFFRDKLHWVLMDLQMVANMINVWN